MFTYFLSILLVVTQLVQAVPIANETIKQESSYRLPDNLAPISYEIELRTFIDGYDKTKYFDKQFVFDVKQSIQFICLRPTNRIVLHSKDLNLKVSTLKLVKYDGLNNSDESKNDQIELSMNTETDTEKDFLILSLRNKNEQLEANQVYRIYMEFSGNILEQPYGLYKSSYEDDEGNIHYLATTQFEPVDARRMIICFDEPGMKAEFQMNIVRPKSMNSLSNGVLVRTVPFEEDNNWEIDRYEKTVKMSTYLLAILVSDFKLIKLKSSKYNIEIEVAAQPDLIDKGQGNYSLHEAAKLLDFYSDYFNVSYPLKKSTQVGIPGFKADAMENWGLITYGNSFLLYDPSSDQLMRQNDVSTCLAHELAHQWVQFGNLVTIEWWNDLWLNEGFATYVQYIGLNNTHPEWNILELFSTYTFESMLTDSLESSHPIKVGIVNPIEINSVFDEITYDKAAAVIKMMSGFLGLSTFNKGVTNYLNKYKYGNTKQENLWEELTKQAYMDGTLDKDLTLTDIMNSWTLKKGYPVVHVSKIADRNMICLTQEWFLLSPINSQNKSDSSYKSIKWFVPFSYRLENSSHTKFVWLKPNNTSNNEDNDRECFVNTDLMGSGNRWILGNLRNMGFYRVNYDMNNWNMLIDQLNENHLLLDTLDRMQLIHDSFYLGRAEYLDQLVFFRLISYLETREENAIPFIPALRGLAFIKSMFSYDHLAFKKLNKYIIKLFKPVYNRLISQLDSNDLNIINLQTNVFDMMCLSGYKDCSKISNSFYEAWKKFNSTLPKNFKEIILKTKIKYGTDDDWFYLYEKAKTSKIINDKLIYVSALAQTQNSDLLKRLLNSTDILEPMNFNEIIVRTTNNLMSRDLVLNFMIENWSTLLKNYGLLPFTLSDIVKNVLGNIYDQNNLRKVKEFVKHNRLGAADKEIYFDIETIEANIRWKEKSFARIIDFIN